MKTGRWILIVLLLGLGFLAGYGYGRWYAKGTGMTTAVSKDGRKILYYHCPMHPNYRSDRPGTAPCCGMKLEPVYEEGEAAPPQAERKVLYYRDPQDHSYRSDVPGLNPETGAELEPVYEGDPASMPPGTVRISAERQQLIGVRFGEVEHTTTEETLRAVGKVAIDERRVVTVHSKVDGWIEKVHVDFTGQLIQKGQPLLTLYSPDMLATQQEYLLALRARDTLRRSPLADASGHSESLLQAARRRLQLWDLSDQQIEEIGRTGTPIKNFTIYAPSSGFVTERNALANQRITPETTLYTITDLSHVWILADVFEYEAARVRLNQNATIQLSYFPGKNIPAKVTYIMPQVDPMTRTLKVRLEAHNPAHLLKPEMFVDVVFRSSMPRMLTVPLEAILDTGLRKTVFVDRGNGYFEPRQVTTGARADGRIQVLSGLQAGERVVTSGNFLIDSESQLKSAATAMTGHQHGAAPAGEPQPKAAAPAQEHKHD